MGFSNKFMHDYYAKEYQIQRQMRVVHQGDYSIQDFMPN